MTKSKKTTEKRWLHVDGKGGGLSNPPPPLFMSADENSVSLVKAALAALCIFRSRKKLCVFVSLCLKKHLRKTLNS